MVVQGGLLLAQLINATYNVLAQHMLTKDGADPIIFSVYRDLAAAPILHGGAMILDGFRTPHKEDVPRIIVQGFLGVFCNQILFLVGMQMTNANVASIVNLLLPVFAGTLSILLGMDSFRWSSVTGLSMAVAGAVYMKAGGPTSHDNPNFTLGVMIIALGAFTSACYYIIQKGSLVKYPPVTVTAWEYWIGFGFMLLAGLPLVDQPGRWHLSPNAMVALFFSVIFNSVVKYALSTYCNKHVSPIVLTTWATLVPVLTVALSAIFLGTPLQWRYLGAGPIIVGTFLVTKGRVEAEKRKEEQKRRDDLYRKDDEEI